MAILGKILRGLARAFEALADTFRRVSTLLNALLPALLPASELASGMTKYYTSLYSPGARPATGVERDWLDAWEIEVLDRYQMTRGTALVLGSGWGRESFALAHRGLSVLGIDTNESAVRAARRRAAAGAAHARFHQASFLDLPYRPASWDYVLMADSMYSAIQGTGARHRLLRELVRVLKPDGLLILSFLPEWQPVSRIKRLATSLGAVLARLPGANRAYQPGDDCMNGHFLHSFLDEAEVTAELRDAGVVIREVNWRRGFAIVAAPKPAGQDASRLPSG